MKRVSVIFIDSKLKQEFNSLKSGKFENKKLHEFINRALTDIKENPSCGVKIPKQTWPKEYPKITNLWKYNLPNAWRLIYTIKTNDIMIISIILEWFSHKDYERKFKY